MNADGTVRRAMTKARRASTRFCANAPMAPVPIFRRVLHGSTPRVGQSVTRGPWWASTSIRRESVPAARPWLSQGCFAGAVHRLDGPGPATVVFSHGDHYVGRHRKGCLYQDVGRPETQPHVSGVCSTRDSVLALVDRSDRRKTSGSWIVINPGQVLWGRSAWQVITWSVRAPFLAGGRRVSGRSRPAHGPDRDLTADRAQ